MIITYQCIWNKQRTNKSCYRGTDYPKCNIQQKNVQGLDSFYKLNEKLAIVPSGTPFTEIFETQPNIPDTEILGPLEEESRDFDKTHSDAIVDIKLRHCKTLYHLKL